MGWGEAGTVLVLLLASLIALVLVMIARREADVARAQAEQDVAQIRDETRQAVLDVERREARAAEREAETRAERNEAKALRAEAADLLAVAAEQEKAARGATEAARTEAAELLASLSGLTAEQARKRQLELAGQRVAHEVAALERRAEASARRNADDAARRILATAAQRLAAATSAQTTVTVVPLPAEEMKGRIIGKEGRNIRAFEALTGVNVIIDETPDSVTLSCFDPERREIAGVALASLVADGRIHPQRIEIAYAEALAGAAERTRASGHDAAERAGVTGLHPELVETLGRLRLRTSYGQNVLEHLVECAQAAGMVAAELGADADLARRAAFLHDVGKALTAEVGGTHAAVGADLAARCGESAEVVNAIAAHHDEVPKETVEAVVVQAVDALSAARPGARREELDQYLERMENLEALVAEHPGVRRALAMAAGREVRVVVEPAAVSDEDLPGLARTIAQHIEKDLSFPGEIVVTVVRELRASATAG
ncbi:ribonuclease Y [Isoptericola sp. b441]|uniref:Ribonuclease Y n=1 Tax=Actinotalea lenta TaxID=3064654 RepID=A0ABT9DA61_9CELL|nr:MULTISPECIES: ribonuclease Y [unclassified Isoptericola]MDO8107391.1 ribonuclease Y [Isoptericola sp. b441]MDO8120946.1 ribonuclease Y [Isoptericola sp. b490]